MSQPITASIIKDTIEIYGKENPETKMLELSITSRKSDEHFKSQVSKYLLKEKNDYDTILIYRQKTYKLHAIILRQSEFIRDTLDLDAFLRSKDKDSVLRRDVTEVLDRVVKDPNPVPHEMLEKFFYYMYCAKFRVPSDAQSALHFLSVARALKLKELYSSLLSWLGTYLTPADACKIFHTAHTRNHTQLFHTCVSLIGTYAEAIFESDACLAFSFDMLKHIAQSERFSIKEETLFDGIKRWIDTHAEKQVAQYTGEQAVEHRNRIKKELWKSIENDIRWPLMDADFIFEKVEPLGYISPHLISEAYTNTVLADYSTVPAVKKLLPKNSRAKSRMGTRWQFSTKSGCCHADIKVSKNGTVITKQGRAGHSSVLSAKGFKSGHIKWKLKLNSSSHWVGVGVAFKSKLTPTLTTDYSVFYGASSRVQLYQMTGPIATWNQNEIIICDLKFMGNTAKFQLSTLSGNTNLVAKIPLTGEDLYPICNLYTPRNELILL